jgi:tripartite-type tricarboxylate transporter receptor subunit TctC
MTFRSFVAAICLLTTGVAFAADPAYPDKATKVVVGFAPGGINDIVARIVSTALAARLGKPFVVENRAGAGGTIGADMVSKATPDGYTLLLGSVSNMVMAPMASTQVPYDPVKDFIPVTLIGGSPNVLVVNAKSSIHNLQDLIAQAKAKPGALGYGSAGNSTSNHLTGELFRAAAGIDVVHVPYKGDAQALVGLIGGETQFMFATVPAAITHIKSGKLRAIAVASPKRSALAPDVPTVEELGIKNFSVNVWVGFLAPAGTPPFIINKLSNEIVDVAKTDAVQKQLLAQGIEPNPSGTTEFNAIIKADMDKWGRVAKNSVATAN